MILHIDMDAFFASIEQAINPRLKGKPLIVGSRPDKMHTVVCAASYQAKALGICSGMNSREAFSICPQLQFVTADQSKYIWTSEQIHDMLKIYGFRLNYASIDEFRMDILNHPQPTTLAEDIRQRIHSRFNITASVGIAGNCLLAKLASKLNKPNGIAIMDDSNLEPILARAPVDKLCGIGKSTNILLRSLGLETCLDLYLKSPQFMQRHLGKAGLNLYAGLHSSESFQEEPLEDNQPKSIGHSYTFPRAGAELREVMLLIRANLSGAGVTHLSGADDADVALQLLAPNHLHHKRLPIGQREIADIQRAGEHRVFGKGVLSRDGGGIDGSASGYRQQRPQATLAAFVTLSQQEIRRQFGGQV